jgi:hypothetical protein
VVPEDRLLDACRELVALVVRHDADAIARQKRLFAAWQNLALDEAIARSQDELVAAFAGGVPQRLAKDRLRRR